MGPAITSFSESRQEGAAARGLAEKGSKASDPAARIHRMLTMDRSVSPLMLFLISALVVLALTVHGVSINDPFYGSDLVLRVSSLAPN